MYQAGNLNRYITIKQPVETEPDAYGRRRVSYEDFAALYARVTDVSGKEYYSAAAIQQEDVVSFTIRNYPVKTDMRIVFDGCEYSIDSINHLSYKGDYLTIRARMVTADG